MEPFTVQVPASSANIGAGFDSMGLAVDLYLKLEVTESTSGKWEFEHLSPMLPPVPYYEEHFIYKIAKQTADLYHKQIPALKVSETSEIPFARGLGSSSSALIAGIEIANQACNLSLTEKEKLQLATEIEGHPDNVAAALFGGFVITATLPNKVVSWKQVPLLDIDVVVFIPDVELTTEAARQVLPETFLRSETSSASAISNVLIAAILSGDYALAGQMMEQDLLHEPYRAALIPNYHEIKAKANKLGAFGTVISGAGPTMISFVPKGEGQHLKEQMEKLWPDYQIKNVQIDNDGVKVKQVRPL